MYVKMTQDAWDKTKLPDRVLLEAGKTLNVTAERGAELILAGVATDTAEAPAGDEPVEPTA